MLKGCVKLVMLAGVPCVVSAWFPHRFETLTLPTRHSPWVSNAIDTDKRLFFSLQYFAFALQHFPLAQQFRQLFDMAPFKRVVPSELDFEAVTALLQGTHQIFYNRYKSIIWNSLVRYLLIADSPTRQRWFTLEMGFTLGTLIRWRTSSHRKAMLLQR